MLLGVTFSSPDELARWHAELNLGCDLLCDESRAVALAYGAAQCASQAKAERVTVLVDTQGCVQEIFRPTAIDTHPGAVLAAL